MKIVPCAECSKELDVDEVISSSCWTCKLEFCDSINHDCFYVHHKKSGYKGGCRTIINPKWICNLVRNMEKE